MEQALYNLAREATDAQKNKILFNLEHANHIVCTLKAFAEAWLLLDSLIRSAVRYGLTFAPSKCKPILFNMDGTYTTIYRWRVKS